MDKVKFSNEWIDESDLKIFIVDRPHTFDNPLITAELAAVKKGSRKSALLVTNEGKILIIKSTDKSWLINNNENWRLLGSDIIHIMRENELKLGTIVSSIDDEIASAIVEGALLGDYRFEHCKKDAKRDEITLCLPKRDFTKAQIVASSQNFARYLGDLPANLLTPQTFIEIVKPHFTNVKNISVKVISGVDALKEANFPGLVQVGQAGVAPALLEIIYQATDTTKENIALVGKGLTFDAGGISIKPAPGMWQMKGDMCGAATVIGAMKIVGALQPKQNIHAYIGLAENLLDSKSQRPGDIYQARNGKFIHVDNTDAEGRLVLADLLTYACENNAVKVLDFATLTGAILIGLGTSIAGIMGNCDTLANDLRAAGQKSGEEWWQLPLFGEYRDLLNHIHADLNNTGGKNAGSITAGIFLSEFISENVKWLHCDIAGTATCFDAPWRYYSKSATGFGVRSLAKFLEC